MFNLAGRENLMFPCLSAHLTEYLDSTRQVQLAGVEKAPSSP
jgi:hypothetical protein